MSVAPHPEREETPRRVRLTDKQRAERQAESIARHWRRAGFSTVKVWLVDAPTGDGVGRHWVVRTNLQPNGLPPGAASKD